MMLLKIIRDSDLGSETPIPETYKLRKAGRAIIFDENRNVALLHVTKKNYHKLPGGGVEAGEGIEAALRLETSEELGCSIANIRELGIIEEYRNKLGLHQISYCFLADLAGDKGVPRFEGDEIADGFEPVWMDIKDAVEQLESEIGVEDYEGKFIRLRDLTFLQEAETKL